MYSDSLNDKPLLDLANKSYFIKKNTIYDYKTYKPIFIVRLWNWCWDIYHKNEELWNYFVEEHPEIVDNSKEGNDDEE